jgi:hypothetical protein
METLLSLLIAAFVTVFFVRRHVKALPPAKPGTRPAQRKQGNSESVCIIPRADARRSPSRGAM